MAKTTSIAERYWAKVDSSAGPDECWPWIGCRDPAGYGRMRDGTLFPGGRGRVAGATRIGYRLLFGPIPDGHGILHHCDNPPCMNPRHWFTGTAADNNADMTAKRRNGGWKTAGDRHGSRLHPERILRGEDQPTSKLSAGQVVEIRSRYAAGGVSQYALAAEFGITQSAVSHIVSRRSWQHI